jgi:outer membrane cobalamin receptor
MKKRGIFSLVVLLALSTLFAAQTTTTDIGTAYELVISDVALAQAETNNSSSVSVITRTQIEAYNAKSTGDLVNKAIGTNFNSYGALGALQTVVIRGASSSKNLIFLDGVLLSSAHDGQVDLSIIPVSSIERIEIIKSGSGNLGRTNAIGGMVNIITKQAEQTEKPFSITVETGSFLPETYGPSNKRNTASLSDSHKYDLTYSNVVGETNLVANLGSITAQNAYTYTDDTPIKALRDNAQVYSVYGSINASRAFEESIEVSSNNLATYKLLGTPGGYLVDPVWGGGLTPNDYQDEILLSTKNTVTHSNFGENGGTIKTELNYTYGRTFFHGTYGDSTHNKNKGNFLVEGAWEFGDRYNVIAGTDFALDYVDSTNIDKETRVTTAIYAHANIYLLDGLLSLHPSTNLTYLSDRKAFSPNASLGAIYTIGEVSALKANISYAENPPTFSQLYWIDPFFGPSGNANLETEKGLQGDIAFSTRLNTLAYEGTLFGRDIHNEIVGFPATNIGHSFYVGTEQAITLDLTDMFALSASYLYNKSFDLSDGKGFSDNVEMDYVRNHTAKASASFAYNLFDAVLSGEYLGKSNKTDQAFVLNLSVNAQVTEDLKVYVAIDNLLNASYELSSGYPMPGTKIRLGGTLKF